MKKTLTAVILAITGAAILLFDKSKQALDSYAEDIKKLNFTIHDVSNLSISGGVFSAGVKLAIFNTTTTNISATTGGLVKLTALDFYTANNVYIGTARPNISSFNFQGNSRTITERIPIEMPINISSITVIASILANPKNIIVKPTLTALNQTYTF